MVYETGEIVVLEKRITPGDVLRSCRAALKGNYPQKPTNATYLLRKLQDWKNQRDTVEAFLRVHDPLGYRQKNWEKVIGNKSAELIAARILPASGEGKWDRYAPLTVWGHDPILTHTGIISGRHDQRLDYQLLGTESLGKRRVFVIRFENRQPNSFNAGYARLSSHSGRVFIDRESFAVLRIDERFTQDTSSHKLTKRDGEQGKTVSEITHTYRYAPVGPSTYALAYARVVAYPDLFRYRRPGR